MNHEKQNLNLDLNTLDVEKIQTLIGLNQDITDEIMSKISTLPPNRSFLPLYCILILENFETTIPLIQQVVEETLNTAKEEEGAEDTLIIDFINRLQQSKYYLHRMAVPFIIKNVVFSGKKNIVKNGLKDEICEVVKHTVNCIRYSHRNLRCALFDEDELVEIAIDLLKSKYMSIRILSVDIIPIINESVFLLMDLIKSPGWRIRLRIAQRLPEFTKEDQKKILKELVNDQVDEVRIELSKNLSSLEYIDLLGDPNENVRANYLLGIIDQIEDEAIFKKLMQDSSWEVKKVLLNLKGEMFKKITIPLIRSSTENVSWRIKDEILGFIEEKVDSEFVSKLLMGFLLKSIQDKVFEVRERAQRILVQIIRKYKWVDEYFYEFEGLIQSVNYLHRISMIPVAIEYDKKYQTDLGKRLKEDKVINVRDYFRDYTKNKGIEYEMRYGKMQEIEDHIDSFIE